MCRKKQQHHLKLQRYERKNKIATFRRELTHHKQYFNENDGHKGIKVFQMNQEYFNYVTMFYAKEDDFPIVLNYGFQDPTQVCGYEFAIPFETIGTQQQQSAYTIRCPPRRQCGSSLPACHGQHEFRGRVPPEVLEGTSSALHAPS